MAWIPRDMAPWVKTPPLSQSSHGLDSQGYGPGVKTLPLSQSPHGLDSQVSCPRSQDSVPLLITSWLELLGIWPSANLLMTWVPKNSAQGSSPAPLPIFKCLGFLGTQPQESRPCPSLYLLLAPIPSDLASRVKPVP
jgi:hypothetical protein